MERNNRFSQLQIHIKNIIDYTDRMKYLLIPCILILFIPVYSIYTTLYPRAKTYSSRIMVIDHNHKTQEEHNQRETFTSVDRFNFDKDYDYPPTPQKEGTVRIPILNYHHIAELPNSIHSRPYYVTPEMFEKQMKYLSDKNYVSLTPTEFFDILVSGKNPIQKSIMITFDDGNTNQYTQAFPILRKYNLIGVFFIVSSKSGISSYALKEMTQAGMIIGSHSKTHTDLRLIQDDEVLTQEITQSKWALSAMSNSTVNTFSYPGCGGNDEVISKVAQSGYLLSFSCGKSIDHTYKSRYSLSRIHVYNNLENFKKRLSGIWEVTYDYE